MLIKFQMVVFIRKLFTTEIIAITCGLASGWCAIEKQSMEEFEVPWCIRGYHIYKDIWHAAIGQHLSCRREPDNTSDRYAVAVIKDGIIVYGPRFFAFFESITFCTSVLARLIASAGMYADSDPFRIRKAISWFKILSNRHRF